MIDILLEGIYILAGLVALMTAITALKDDKHPKRFGTTTFWGLLGFIFIVGKYLPPVLVGSILLFMGVLTATKQVTFGSLQNSTDEFREKKAMEVGSKIFIPALSIAVVAFGTAQFTDLGGLVGLGFGAIIATILALTTTKTNPKYVSHDGSRLLQQVGSASILPQLLAALGALFNAAGVGEVISGGISGIIPEGNILAGVIAYCIGMALFTMIMGNAFAAFAVITAGIGLPFVFAQGADPAIAGIIALTAGYCGTLMTPMAANFNVVPAAILETKNKNRVILSQIPVAGTLLVIHIVLMYTLAF
ncbi:DUF979 domain-containing protein [Clostridium sp. D2Q-11]|uniref:DUF979 domain-containing protein n=1 Tax=Anaeromonas frigoriresistens TaxID=2683708 RepID=A0A942UWV7_9FIRM|nr:DUF979 domain-containing protein [Anaeromonas frigoriresistens]MBS4538294.1 DUF979 domain-containing protein [Anaeromonas frigoriresistens]